MNTRILSWTACIAGSTACATTPAIGGAGDTETSDAETGDAAICGPEAEVGVQVGMCAPEFSLPDRNEVAFSLHAQRGKVALVDISAIW